MRQLIGSTSRFVIFMATVTVCTLSLAEAPEADCQCRAPGGAMRALGTVECISIAGSRKMVLCTMSTNTPYWKDIENVDGCPTA